MKWKEILANWWNTYRPQFVTALLVLLTALLGGTAQVAYERGQHNPAPEAVASAIAENPLLVPVRKTPTPPALKTATPTKTATVKPSATSTAIVVTVTPGATMTIIPATPSDGLPLCATHDLNLWHSLVSLDGSCHYNHTHKHDPMEACGAKFGEPGAWFGEPGRSISYPWMTPLENDHKHEAYAWVVRCDIPPFSNPLDESANFTKNFRVQVHLDPIPFLMPLGNWAGGHIGAQHSISLELEICVKAKPDDCGIFQFGGWINMGDLNIRNEKGENLTFCAPLPDVSENCDPTGTTGGGDGGSRIYFDALGPPFNPDARSHGFFWYGEMSKSDVQTTEIINPTVFAVAMADSMAEVSLDNLLFQDPIQSIFCPKFDCIFNGSTISMHEISLVIPTKLDSDGNGYVDGVFFTDQYGRLLPECMSTDWLGDLACIPWKFTHVPVGGVKYGDPENLGIGIAGTQDFDLSPAFLGTGDAWWITWPLRFFEAMEHSH